MEAPHKTPLQQALEAILPQFCQLPSTHARERAIVLLTQSLTDTGEWTPLAASEVTQVVGDIAIIRAERDIMAQNVAIYQYS